MGERIGGPGDRKKSDPIHEGEGNLIEEVINYKMKPGDPHKVQVYQF